MIERLRGVSAESGRLAGRVRVVPQTTRIGPPTRHYLSRPAPLRAHDTPGMRPGLPDPQKPCNLLLVRPTGKSEKAGRPRPLKRRTTPTQTSQQREQGRLV